MSKTLENGSFQDAVGTVVNGGTIEFVLSQDAALIAGGQVAPTRVSAVLDSSGDMPSAFTIAANDELTPSGTFYLTTVFDSNGARVFGPERWVFSGASPIDLDTMVPTIIDPAFADPILSNPSVAQSIADFNITMPLWNSIAAGDGVKHTTPQAVHDAAGANGFFVLPPGFGENVSFTLTQPRSFIDMRQDNPYSLGSDFMVLERDQAVATEGTEPYRFYSARGTLSGTPAGMINFQGFHGDFNFNVDHTTSEAAAVSIFHTINTTTPGRIWGAEFHLRNPHATAINNMIGVDIIMAKVPAIGATFNAGLSLNSGTDGGAVAAATRSGHAVYINGNKGWTNAIEFRETDDTTVLFRVDQTGQTFINSDTNPTNTPDRGLVISDAAATTRGIGIQTAKSQRWLISANSTSESGSDVGSDFGIAAYNDAGNGLGDALQITRSTRNVTIPTTLTTAVANPLEGSLSNQPRWIFKQVDHTDMTAGAPADPFPLWTLPANTMIHDVMGTVTAAWAGAGPVSAAVASVGTNGGAANDLTLDDNFFSAATVYELHDATASGGKGALLYDATDKFAPYMAVSAATVELQMDLTGGDHADTSAGQARIYMLVSQPLGNTTTEAN